MEIVKETHRASFEAMASVDYVDLGKDLSVFRLTREFSSEGVPPGLLRPGTSNSVSEGFVSTTALLNHIAGHAPFPPRADKVHLVSSTFLPNIARYGYSAGSEQVREDDAQFDANKPFTALVENGVSVAQVLLINYSSHQVFDRTGLIMPTGIQFDYLSGYIDNGHYDLDQAVRILEQNPRVNFIGHNKEGKPEIQFIGSYNASEHRSRYLSFMFEPTQEEQQALWEKQKSYGGDFPSTERHRAVFDLDILGLRAGGAALYDDFYKSREYDDAYQSAEDDDC